MTIEDKNAKGLEYKLLATLPVSVFTVDAKGNIDCWTEPMEQLTGHTAEAMMGKKTWQAFFSKKKRTPADQALVSQEEEIEEDFVVTHAASGAQTPVRFVARPVVNGEGETLGATVTLMTEKSSQGVDQGLSEEVSRVATAIQQGIIKERADLSRFADAQTGSLLKTINEMLDSLVKGFLPATEYIQGLSSGKNPAKHVNPRQGFYEEIRTAINIVADQVNMRGADIQQLTAAIKEGNLAFRADIGKYGGSYSGAQVAGINEMLDAVVGPLMLASRCIEGFSRGRTPEKVTETYKGDFETIKNNINALIDVISNLVGETGTIMQGAANGALKVRTDAEKSQGVWRKILRGVNETLDAVVNPLNVAAQYVDRISRGDIPPKITEEYKGDYNQIKNNLNTCIEAINQLVQETGSLANAAQEGNLTHRADTSKAQGEYRTILVGVNQTVQILHDAMAQVADATGQVATAADEIASSSQSVAQGASEQASALEETSSTLEQISSMTKQNADNTQQAKTLALSTRDVGNTGNTAMQKMIESMHKIRSSAEGTAEIIRDINEISFQTNLLALNAAVEAARAGDAGRGFAVVAEEVRNLALRSKEAAKKTEELIKQSVRLAGEGESISNEVSKDLQQIVESVSKVTDIVGEIAAASLEQAHGVEQVNKAVSDMDKVVQQSAANSEQSSSAAQELSSQSQQLAALVSRFQLSKTAAAPAAAKAKRPVATRGLAKAKGAASRSGTDGGAPLVRPEDVIPLEDDPDFKEF